MGILTLFLAGQIRARVNHNNCMTFPLIDFGISSPPAIAVPVCTFASALAANAIPIPVVSCAVYLHFLQTENY
ncbi:hypothetical protein LZ32DRAFT_602784 [Colletotrichum eremochloae]|nr:hypothetical protein LZ32DRAFT_602784 [Colletotrichum eremochloae]